MTGSHDEIHPTDREALDLSALDPIVGTSEWAELVARIVRAAEPELHRRAEAASSPLTVLAGWSRPILAAAAVVALLAVGALARDGMGDGPLAEASGGELPELLGLPSPVSAWLSEERSPTTNDVVLAFEEGGVWR